MAENGMDRGMGHCGEQSPRVGRPDGNNPEWVTCPLERPTDGSRHEHPRDRPCIWPCYTEQGCPSSCPPARICCPGLPRPEKKLAIKNGSKNPAAPLHKVHRHFAACERRRPGIRALCNSRPSGSSQAAPVVLRWAAQPLQWLCNGPPSNSASLRCFRRTIRQTKGVPTI